MKRPYKRRCGSSIPDSDGAKGWHYCYHPAEHNGQHEDDDRLWNDGMVVEVKTVATYAMVPDHEHYFRPDSDGDAQCTEVDDCTLTWNEHMRQQARWEQEQQDICSYCGHAEHCHTFEARDEGGRDYCTECDGKDEFHAMDEEPMVYVPGVQQLVEAMRQLTGPSMPQERLEAAAARAYVLLGVQDPEPATSPQDSPQARLDVMRARVEGTRPRGVVVDELRSIITSTEPVLPHEAVACEEIAVECACGTIWPDGVMGKGHNDMDCDQDEPEIPQAPQNDMDDDVCFCGCTRGEHRSSLNWGESCDGCTAKGPRATYQWRHPFNRDVGRIKG
jgi:hypothetical protein